jgi:mitochondrial fission protein ELM1
MVSEACSTGKPVYMYQLPGSGKRHKQFCESLIRGGHARVFTGMVEDWKNTPLDETRKAADFVVDRFMKERWSNEYADTHSRNAS